MGECLVCLMPNTGQHFGVSCCRACAAFFRRTIQLNLQYQCRFGADCDVTKKNRYSCRACRLRRCFAIGMGKDVGIKLETDPGPSTFVDYQIYPDQNDLPSISDLEDSCKPKYQWEVFLEPVNTNNLHANIQKIIKFQLDAIFEKKNPPEFPFEIPLSLCQQAMLAYAKHNEQWPNCTPEKIVHTVVVDLNLFMRANYAEVEHVASFCMSIQPFARLPIQQKWLVFKHFWPRFVEMDRVFTSCKLLGYDVNDDRIVSYDGKVLNFSCHFNRLEEFTNFSETQLRGLLQKTQDVFKDVFGTPFKKYRPDEFELMYLSMCCMWNVRDLEGIDPETLRTADIVRDRLCEDLYNYYAFEIKCENYAQRLYKLSHLVTALDKVLEKRNEDVHMSKTFNIFKHDIYLNDLK